MKKYLLIFACFIALFSLAFSIKPKKQQPFPDFGYMAPVNEITNINEVFKLSQNYPKTLPSNKLPEFYSIDYKKDWRNYLLSIRSYCYEGNTGVNFIVFNSKIDSCIAFVAIQESILELKTIKLVIGITCHFNIIQLTVEKAIMA